MLLRIQVRPAELRDLEALASLRGRLWSDVPVDQLRDDASAILIGEPRSTLPVVLFVAASEADDGVPIAFVEVGLRSHADGCDPRRPVGFIEAWYVAP
ncbi:hypothetical protein [Pendulispora albinea]|uniref:GNAT family N-acetyltransferase n=1 Tax=Pendulispora albinea TaxID=2741071 RepID=A0ABZ2M0E1_9BACT